MTPGSPGPATRILRGGDLAVQRIALLLSFAISAFVATYLVTRASKHAPEAPVPVSAPRVESPPPAAVPKPPTQDAPPGMVWVRPYEEDRTFYLVQAASGLISQIFGR